MPVTRWYPQFPPFPEQGEEVKGLKVAAAGVVELELSQATRAQVLLPSCPPRGHRQLRGAQILLGPAGRRVGSWLTEQTTGVRSLTQSALAASDTRGLVEISLPGCIDFLNCYSLDQRPYVYLSISSSSSRG